MALTISSSFDAGNIRVVHQDGDRADLEIVKDHMSDFYQWFYFRLAGAAGREVTRLAGLLCALFDGAAPRPRDPHRRPARRRLLLARQEPRRAGHRLPDDRRRPVERVALRPPAPRREYGRMVDGRRARQAY